MSCPADTFTDLVLEVFRLNGALLAAGDALSAPCGLTSARWQVLGALAGEPQTVAQIARAMGLTRQGVQRTVDVLRQEGVVELIDNPAHKRARLVVPTPHGRAMLDRVSGVQRQWAEAVTAGVADADLAAARDLIRALRTRLEEAASCEPS